jgi:hypothetical protein
MINSPVLPVLLAGKEQSLERGVIVMPIYEEKAVVTGSWDICRSSVIPRDEGNGKHKRRLTVVAANDPLPRSASTPVRDPGIGYEFRDVRPVASFLGYEE